MVVTPPGPGRRVDTAALKQANPIEDVAVRYGIDLRPQGRALVGRCPLHVDGGRPNFFVYRHSQSWRCYRCNVGGDVLSLVRLIEQLPFREAADRLSTGQLSSSAPAKIAPKRPPAAPVQHDAMESESDAVLQAAVTLYHQHLLGDERALAYLERRGIDRPTIERCLVGYALGDQLLPLLRWRGLPLWAALKTGLLNRRGHEHLAGRIVVPELRHGHPVWLVGRLVDSDGDEKTPKYVNLPGPRPLLGWDQARSYPTVVVVEGVFDFLALRMWGYPVLALLGTDVRQELLADLRSFQRVYLVLDNDAAGRQAVSRLQEQIGPPAFPVALPDGVKDVAALTARSDAQALFAATLLEAVGTTPPASPR
jgi:DNA primase